MLMLNDYTHNLDEYSSETKCDIAYERKKAVEYALSWLKAFDTLRNEDFGNYDEFGGNDTNFVSQSLLAGGIVMDYEGFYQWKYFSDYINENEEASGRSSSWISLGAFYDYCLNNSGTGIDAVVNPNLYTTEIGDVVQMSSSSMWERAAIVTKVITNEDNVGVMFLISSNSPDIINYPLDACSYDASRIIKIYGSYK